MKKAKLVYRLKGQHLQHYYGHIINLYETQKHMIDHYIIQSYKTQ